MAIVSNTFTKYDVVGLREDLADVIYNISPETTPFISNMTKRRQVTNTFFEWQVDSLASAQVNAVLDGDDLSSFTAVTPTSRLGNYTMISRKDFIIADMSSRWDGKPVNKQDADRSGLACVMVRYGKRLEKVCSINLIKNRMN